MKDACHKWRMHAHKAESNSVIYTLSNSEISIAIASPELCLDTEGQQLTIEGCHKDQFVCITEAHWG